MFTVCTCQGDQLWRISIKIWSRPGFQDVYSSWCGVINSSLHLRCYLLGWAIRLLILTKFTVSPHAGACWHQAISVRWCMAIYCFRDLSNYNCHSAIAIRVANITPHSDVVSDWLPSVTLLAFFSHFWTLAWPYLTCRFGKPSMDVCAWYISAIKVAPNY